MKLDEIVFLALEVGWPLVLLIVLVVSLFTLFKIVLDYRRPPRNEEEFMQRICHNVRSLFRTGIFLSVLLILALTLLLVGSPGHASAGNGP